MYLSMDNENKQILELDILLSGDIETAHIYTTDGVVSVLNHTGVKEDEFEATIETMNLGGTVVYGDKDADKKVSVVAEHKDIVNVDTPVYLYFKDIQDNLKIKAHTYLLGVPKGDLETSLNKHFEVNIEDSNNIWVTFYVSPLSDYLTYGYRTTFIGQDTQDINETVQKLTTAVHNVLLESYNKSEVINVLEVVKKATKDLPVTVMGDVVYELKPIMVEE